MEDVGPDVTQIIIAQKLDQIFFILFSAFYTQINRLFNSSITKSLHVCRLFNNSSRISPLAAFLLPSLVLDLLCASVRLQCSQYLRLSLFVVSSSEMIQLHKQSEVQTKLDMLLANQKVSWSFSTRVWFLNSSILLPSFFSHSFSITSFISTPFYCSFLLLQCTSRSDACYTVETHFSIHQGVASVERQ